MARKNLIRTNEYPYHVTIRSNNKEWFNLPLTEMWTICINAIRVSNFKVPVKVEAFVLMNNHYHLLLYTPNSNLDKFMNVLNSKISKDIRIRTNRINRVFGDRYKWKLITCNLYYKSVIRYIFQNPLEVKLVTKCEDYVFSTLYYQKRNISLGLELPQEFTSQNYIKYINEQIETQTKIEIKKSLKQIGISHSQNLIPSD